MSSSPRAPLGLLEPFGPAGDARRAQQATRGPALLWKDHALSSADLGSEVAAGAARLRAAGAAPGTRVLLGAPEHSPGWVVGLLAALAAESAVVLPDPQWEPADRRALLDELEPRFVLDADARPRRIGNGGDTACQPEGGLWLFTSGTTARPRPRFRSSRALAAMVARVASRLPQRIAAARPVALCVLPLYHGYGLVNTLFLVQRLGGTLAMAHDIPIGELPERMAETGARMLYGWPRHFRLLGARGLWPVDAKPDWCVSSSNRLDPAVAAAFLDASGCPVRQQYGTTETGPLSLDAECPPVARPGCVGRPLDGVQIELRDDEGRPVPAGSRGRIFARLAAGSVDPQLLGRDGSYDCGDLGFADEAGRLFIERRAGSFFDERKNA